MAADQRGLQPRKLELAGEVEMKMVNPEPSRSTASKYQAAELQAIPLVSENTEAKQEVQKEVEAEAQEPQQDAQEDVEKQPQEQVISQREANRVQVLANAKAQAEARAAQAEAMLARLVNVQPSQPVVSEEEQLAKQFKSYDPQVGYPTDAKEYVDFTRMQARLESTRVVQEVTRKNAESQDFSQALISVPELASDAIMQGVVSAKKAQAQAQGINMSWQQAAIAAKQELEGRVKASRTAQEASDTQAKNEAYVETTKGASTNRQTVSKPSAGNMSLQEMERWLRENGEW